MKAAPVAVGMLLVVGAIVDLIWTTIAAGSGAGPLTRRVGTLVWRAFLLLRRGWRWGDPLSVAGVATIVAVLAFWIVLVWSGWWLIFSSSGGSVVSTTRGADVGALNRFYFVGYAIFTLGNGEYRPAEGIWQVATVAATGTGLVFLSLAISYLVSIPGAVAQRRQLAGYISSLGTTPEDAVARSWTGHGFGALPQHLVALAPMLHGTAQRHLTYPVLHYFHSRDRRTASAPTTVFLAQVLLLLRHAVAPASRPDHASLTAVEEGLRSFLDTLAGAYIRPRHEPLPLPDLAAIREQGVPTVSDSEYVSQAGATLETRRLLRGFLEDNAWSTPHGSLRIPNRQAAGAPSEE